MKKIITKSYNYFGRQCDCCGAYFTYTVFDAAGGPICPSCFRKFTHSINDPDIDIEPDAKIIKTQQALRTASSETVILPEFSLGQKVCVICREAPDTSWRYYGLANVEAISCTVTRDQQGFVYTLDTPVNFRSSSVVTTQDGAVEIYGGPTDPYLLSKLDKVQQALLPSQEQFKSD